MNDRQFVQARTFHGQLDSDITLRPSGTETGGLELSYRFSLHQHPYVQALIQRLIRRGTGGLQAADTEYAAGDISLPYGVDVVLEGETQCTLSKGSRLKGLASGEGGGVITNSLVKEGTRVTLGKGARVTLVDPLESTPFPKSKLSPSPARNAVIAFDEAIKLTEDTLVLKEDGTEDTLQKGTSVMLASGSGLILLEGADLTVIRRRMRPAGEFYSEFFEQAYAPNPDPSKQLVQRPYPVKDLDFSSSGAYGAYNWELFFHVPITIAIHLSKNQRFAEAQRWFHYLFDPTDDSDGPTPERFWKVRPFQTTEVEKIEEILVNLATGTDPKLRDETSQSIEAWMDAPFRPHVIARHRQQAYMYKTVMAYLDNLVAWGDSLFRQDTGESIDEALMLYVLAANILGPRPLPVPQKGTIRPRNYANLRKDLAQFGTVMREIESDLPFDVFPFPSADASDNSQLATVRSLGKALYFCVPRNDKLMGYWDTVADRLYKIRNSLNFQGTFRQLALFEPPIDPAMLARAAAAGLDVDSIVNGVNQPLPLVRFTFLIQRAAEIAQEVKSLGSSLLSAMEKEDGEALALLRAKHERTVMEMVEHVKYGQLQEATKSTEGLLQSLALAVQRYTYYELQLGRKADEIEKALPTLSELDKDDLANMKLSATEPALGLRPIEVDIATDAIAQVAKMVNGGKLLSSHEVHETLLLEAVQIYSDISNLLSAGSSVVAGTVPQFTLSAQPLGVGGQTTLGGQNVASGIEAGAKTASGISSRLSFEARRASRIDSFARREREWTFQSNLAAGEISQIFKQIRAAEIREAIAGLELENHRQQMKHAKEIEQFLNQEGGYRDGKKTNKALYVWMKREIKGLYAQCFQLAFDIARKAERALQHELGNADLSFLEFGDLAGKEGLLAGEKLYLAIKHMEMAYHDNNKREYELTKHVSLQNIAPLELLHLRTTGKCTVNLPEELFDMDGPGHYFRRIKTVALSIPCIAGPYTSVNCTLTLLKSSIRRKNTDFDAGYKRSQPADEVPDSRFDDYFGSVQSIVTSSAQNDSGLFETNLRDERYLPFENSGAISNWQLQLPGNPGANDLTQFDYGTISDVILHIRYTAREGGEQLRNKALENMKNGHVVV